MSWNLYVLPSTLPAQAVSENIQTANIAATTVVKIALFFIVTLQGLFYICIITHRCRIVKQITSHFSTKILINVYYYTKRR